MRRASRSSGARHLTGKGRRRRLTSAVAGLAMAAATPGLVAIAAPAAHAAGGASQLRVLAARPQLPGGTRDLGTLPAGRTVSGAVALKPSDPAGLAAFATAVSTPSSSLYHHYLTPGEFSARFGPTRAEVASVEGQLRASGVDVTLVSSNRLLVDFRSTAAKLGAAFHTTLRSYRLAGGRTAFAPTSAVKLPATVAGSVQSVIGLDTLAQAHPQGMQPMAIRGDQTGRRKAKIPSGASQATAGGPAACSAASAAATEYGGLTDTQIANAYGVNGLYRAGDTGAGQTIAVYELEPFRTADIKAFDTCYFGSAKAGTMAGRLSVTKVDGGQQTGPGSGEAELDIEDVSALAPGAKIQVYEAPNTSFGAVDEYNAIVSADQAKEITTSWGLCEPDIQRFEPGSEAVENVIFEQAAAQGQAVFAAAGDAGTDTCAYHAASPVLPVFSLNDPASQPYVTSVGGTTITDATNPPVEQVWNDGNEWGAGGGGISAVWSAPAWQKDAKVPGLFNRTVLKAAGEVAGAYQEKFCSTSLATCRETPDVSAQADEFTGAITVDYDGTWETFGGTSSATPLWAAMLADINASKACTATSGVGFADPALYAVASVPSEYAASFNDVTTGNNDGYGATAGLFPASKGYDMATGLGTPRVTGPGGAKGLAFYLCDNAGSAAARVDGLNPAAVSESTATTVTVTGSGFENGTTPDVAGVQVGAAHVTGVKVTSPTTLTFTSPLAAALAPNGSGQGSGIYDVTVTLTNGKTSPVTPAGRLTVYHPSTSSTAAPVVATVQPSGGNEATPPKAVTIYGSGFTGATQVTFGGVAATNVVVSDGGDELTVTPPAYSSTATTCLISGELTKDGVCQTQVQVTTPNGTSAPATIKPGWSGKLSASHPNEESVPATTEFDYVPTPHLTSFTWRSATRHYANENGGSVITLHGTGFSYLTLLWIDVGPPADNSSLWTDITYVTPTAITVQLPAIAPTKGVTKVPVSVQTMGSPNIGNYTQPPSNELQVPYAPPGVPAPPVVTSVSTANGRSDGPSSGGTVVTITGRGFSKAIGVLMTDTGPNDFSSATFYVFDVVSNDKIELVTTGANPGIDYVQVCSTAGCSTNTKALFTYYPPGRPKVASVSPGKGKAGTKVTITGTSLGFVKAVYFGTTKAKTFANGPALLDDGNTGLVTATAPAGTAGKTVNVRVVTLASLSAGHTPKSAVNRHDRFTYSK